MLCFLDNVSVGELGSSLPRLSIEGLVADKVAEPLQRGPEARHLRSKSHSFSATGPEQYSLKNG